MVLLNISSACKLIPPFRSEEPVVNSRVSVFSLVGRVASLSFFFCTIFMLYYLGASPAGKIIVVSIINNF